MNELQKKVNLILYVLDKTGGTSDFLTVFKVLYFADREHLVRYGSLITNDRYVAMKNGPVPSTIYDILKIVRGDSAFSDLYYHERFFSVHDRYKVEAKELPDLEFLSETEVECLAASVVEHSGKAFGQLSSESHQLAYNSANLNSDIDPIKIAEEGGASPEMLKYIAENSEIGTLFS
jgi:uncharacterized phage-associated protein